MASIEQKQADTLELVKLTKETVESNNKKLTIVDEHINTVGKNVVNMYETVKTVVDSTNESCELVNKLMEHEDSADQNTQQVKDLINEAAKKFVSNATKLDELTTESSKVVDVTARSYEELFETIKSYKLAEEDSHKDHMEKMDAIKTLIESYNGDETLAITNQTLNDLNENLLNMKVLENEMEQRYTNIVKTLDENVATAVEQITTLTAKTDEITEKFGESMARLDKISIQLDTISELEKEPTETLFETTVSDTEADEIVENLTVSDENETSHSEKEENEGE